MDFGNISITGNSIKPPCSKDCSDRTVGCHSVCEAYNNYVKRKDEIKKEIYKKKDADSEFIGFKRSSIDRGKHRR